MFQVAQQNPQMAGHGTWLGTKDTQGAYLASTSAAPLGSLKGEIWYTCLDVADVIKAPLSSFFIL